MKKRRITAKKIAEFKEYLISEERSAATVEKYIRDVGVFAAYVSGDVTKETVIAYKKYLQGKYAVRSVNSMLSSMNSLFVFLGWYDLKVKALKLQQQVYCPEEKELTKAEYARLCRAAERKHNERLNLILQTICGTGIRVSELQFITVEAVRSGAAVVSCKGKTRSVFIVRELIITTRQTGGLHKGYKPITPTRVSRRRLSLCSSLRVFASLATPKGVN